MEIINHKIILARHRLNGDILGRTEYDSSTQGTAIERKELYKQVWLEPTRAPANKGHGARPKEPRGRNPYTAFPRQGTTAGTFRR